MVGRGKGRDMIQTAFIEGLKPDRRRHTPRKVSRGAADERYKASKKGKLRHARYWAKKRGLSLAQYLELKRSAINCPICLCEMNEQPGDLKLKSLDHDHETGIVRGVICRACNQALGLLDEDPETMARLAKWIMDHR
jgi:hypothetical protein